MSGYEKYQDQPGDNILAQISAMAERQVEAEAAVAEAERILELRTKELKAISEDALPDLMDAAGMTEVTTKSGHKVKLDENIFASISKERAPAGLAWLIANGHRALIKDEFKVQFPRGSEEQAAEFEKLVAQYEKLANVAHTTSVHPSTLTSWVREQLAEGADIPLDVLGVTRRRVTKIK